MDMDSERLRKARNLMALSQWEAAELLKVGNTTYQKWEQGKRKPHPSNLRRIREIYGAVLQQAESLPETRPDAPPARDEDVQAGNAPLESCTGQQSTDQSESLAVFEAAMEAAVVPAFPTPMGTTPLVTIDYPHTFLTRDLTTRLQTIAFTPYTGYHDLHARIVQTLKEFDAMNTNNKNYQLTRREALSRLAILPMVTLGLSFSAETVHPTQYGTFLEHCAAGIEGCWQLYNKGEASDLHFAFQCVSAYLPVLDTIARSSAIYRKEALEQATCCALVKRCLGSDCARSAETVQYAQQAVDYSKETGDISLQLSAYSKLTWAYFRDHKKGPALTAAREAAAHLKHYQQLSSAAPLHPAILGSTYSNLAVMQARNNVSADYALGQALEIKPGDEERDYMKFQQSTLLLDTGWTYCYQGNQAKVQEILAKQIDLQTFAPKIMQSARARVEAMNILALASLNTRDRSMEQTEHFWVAGIEEAKAIKSEQRFTQAVATYEDMQIAWPGEQRIANLRDHIVHW